MRAAVAAAGADLNDAAGETVCFAFHIDADGSDSGDNYEVAAYYWDGSAVVDAEDVNLQLEDNRTYATATAGSEPTAVPEIDGSTIPLLAFIMGTIGLGLRRRRAL